MHCRLCESEDIPCQVACVGHILWSRLSVNLPPHHACCIASTLGHPLWYWLSLFVDINSMWRQGKRRGYNGDFRPADKPGCHHRRWVILSVSFRITRCLLLNTDIPICMCPIFYDGKSIRTLFVKNKTAHFWHANVCVGPNRGVQSCSWRDNVLQSLASTSSNTLVWMFLLAVDTIPTNVVQLKEWMKRSEQIWIWECQKSCCVICACCLIIIWFETYLELFCGN